jgi:hypothetical protein
MKKTAYLLVVAVLMCAAPAIAQGPFNDVPTDHWAYDAVNQLQKDGIVIGYPDGTYGGKRAMSRYEFAVAIARLLPMIPMEGGPDVNLDPYAKKSDLNKYALKSEIPTMPMLDNLATKADVNALRRLVDEFRDELAALGVDVDALKRDVCALGARVDAIEAELKRVRFTGDVNVFGIAGNADEGTVYDLDERMNPSFNDGGDKNTLGRSIAVVRDFDLNIVGRASDSVTAVACINYGNYLNYLGVVDDYVDGIRPTSKNDSNSWATPGPDGPGGSTDFIDGFFPYYLYIDMLLGSGNVQVGRFPMQFTPYTLKKIDVDSYTSILKTDDGNYPVDGIKMAYDFGGVDLTLFAVKHDENTTLRWGLVGQPSAGLFADYNFGPASDAGGHAVGGLEYLVAQSAGARAVIGTPWKGNLGLTYYQAWSEDAWLAFADYDQARVYGADISIPFGSNLSVAGSWTTCDTLASDRAPAVTDIDDDNTAWDAKIAAGFGKLGIGAGYKRIESNFAAAGAWDKIGRWTNPADVKGPYVDVSFPISGRLRFVADAEFLKFIDGVDMDLTKAEGGLRWGFSRSNSLDLGYQWVNYDPNGFTESKETYLTVGWAHQMTPNAGFKVAYQFINYEAGTGTTPYGPDDYKGGLGVVQFGVSF